MSLYRSPAKDDLLNFCISLYFQIVNLQGLLTHVSFIGIKLNLYFIWRCYSI